jgi:hypothetical protein
MNDQLVNIRKILEGLKPELSQKYAVDTLGLFGSIVRDDFTKESDIDIIVTFNRPVGIEFIDLANELEEKLNRKIDLVSKNGVKEKYFRIIESQIIYV